MSPAKGHRDDRGTEGLLGAGIWVGRLLLISSVLRFPGKTEISLHGSATDILLSSKSGSERWSFGQTKSKEAVPKKGTV